MIEQEYNLCPNCFHALHEGDVKCAECGYQLGKKPKNIFALPPMTVVCERYVVGRTIGSGGFGVTYIAKDMLTEEICAIKEYLPGEWVYRKTGDDMLYPNSSQKKAFFEKGRKHFLDEAKMLVKFENQPNIVRVKNFFAYNNTAYLVMEYLDGVNLRTLINRNNGKIDFGIAVEVFLTVAHALEAVHSKNVLHRDISSENIFITKEAQIKLIDFGSAKQIMTEKERSFSVVLKPGIAPIEQYSNQGNQGPWTDIYALASMFYEAVSGIQVPEATKRKEEDTLKPLYEVCPKANSGWSAVISKSLELLPEDRYQNIGEMIEDIYNKTEERPPNPIPKKPVTPKPRPPEISQVMRPFIYFEKTDLASKKNRKFYIEPNHEYTVGRSANMSEIVVDSRGCVSRRHCIIIYSSAEKSFFVKDISANGTYYSSGMKMNYNVFKRVEPGSVIFIGTTETAIRLGAE